LKKITSLKLSSSILFWFGILFQFFTIYGYSREYYLHGTISELTFELIFSGLGWWFGVVFLLYTFLGHGIHITSAYWISKGRFKGIIIGLGISVYEIVSFLVPEIDPDLFTNPVGIPIRILFVIVILLIIYGRTSTKELQSQNWRPWKNPLKDYVG
jgi:hypothetical protein